MEKNSYILSTIHEIIEVLGKNEYRAKRYNRDVEWFKERERIYKSNIIRVAIMGITSSGKSTLVNALLGEKILPMAIRPSSSIIITAAKGDKRQATVYFKDKNPKILKDDDLTQDNISEYADEERNSNNKYNVTQIDITTPYYKLDDNIHIIDSPGLDAWNLENHEKLTLEVLLPTIDICIFLTTVKASSDGTNAEKIKIVSEKGKQIVLVQNMIDSIEEKIGKNGIVEEDKITILKKHMDRAKKLLREVIKAEENLDIVQISALNGLKGIISEDKKLYRSSNMKAFIDVIKNCVMRTTPKLDYERAFSIKERINNIINTDKEIINGNDLEDIEELIKIKANDIDKLSSNFESAQEKIYLKVKEIEKIISETIAEIIDLSSESVDDYLEIVDKINNKKLYIESDILNIVKDYEKEKRNIYNLLNLDIRFSYILPSIESKNIEIKHKYEERTMLFKKDGVLNKGKRLLSDIFDKEWGYKEVGYDEQIIDKEATIQRAQKICDKNKIKYMDILKEWSIQYKKSIDMFYDEVNKREKEYEEKKNQNIEVYDIDDTSKSLSLIRDKLLALKGEQHHEIEVTNPDYEKRSELYSISKAQYNFYRLSNKVIEDNYLLVGEYVRKQSLSKDRQDVKDIFWTWDVDSCRDFILRIYGIYLNEQECNKIRNNGIYYFDNIVIIHELSKYNFNLQEKLKAIKYKKCNIYVIFNGIQIGSSKKNILESRNLSYFFKNNDNLFVNLVIDSCREFINANNVQELLLEVNNLKDIIINKFYKADIGYILINSKNPIYNMALIESQEKHNFLISDYKIIKEKLIENTLSKGKEEKETLEAILSYFLNIPKYEGVEK
ncbi:dynamin family protein [uncultured Clostridium sp.]|uniref:dynamin family protein n=1 Tax=uncultured Clostridium sp. TaxID=59620 RepID=UPI0028EC0DE5|nr:dynamin family protein [uncultured Clostridium sp.]